MKRAVLSLSCLLVLALAAMPASTSNPMTVVAPPDPSMAPAAASALLLAAPASVPPLAGGAPPMGAEFLTCTSSQCLSECTDCPWGYINYCISLKTCTCGCRR